MRLTEGMATQLLKQVYDPELGVNVVDLGLVYDLRCEDNEIYVRMTLTTPGCPLHDTMKAGVERMLQGSAGDVPVRVELVCSPPWTPERMSEEAKRQLNDR